jgi:hypothetical protein
MYFTGVVETADDFGILIRQLDGNLKGFFIWDKIVGISEEKILNPDKPEDKEVIESLKPMVTGQIKSGPLVDPLGMKELIKQVNSAGH